LQRLLTTLSRGRAIDPALGPPRDPWHAILYENVAYLCADEVRRSAFATLKRTTGLDADMIAAAPDEVLLAATGQGKLASQRVTKLRLCAELFGSVGDPRQLVDLPVAKARAALKRFPGIGDPGADRLLLFAAKAPRLALESNGLRALLRLGYGTESKAYAASYRSAQAAAAAEMPELVDDRIDLFAVLRRHGQETCRATPDCATCAVATDCPAAPNR